MSVISSPKSLATRGRLIEIEGGSSLQPAIMLEATTRGRLNAKFIGRNRKVISIADPRTAKTFNILEMRHVG